ncbi:MAG: peptidoglycan DD-metalloendopeptidase family protein [Lachnospiraceae bacterium]|nr:peptidoglycan DD-metalloendopeptidase family protein [Lachnospiraceae bacterium]
MWKKHGMRFLVLCLVLSLSFPVYASSTKDKLSDAEQDRKDMQNRIEAVEDKIKELDALRKDAKAYIAAMDAELAKAEENLVDLQNQTAAKEEEIAQTEIELAHAKEVESEQYESMKIRIQFMFENGNQSYLDLILNSGSIEEILNKVEYISQITEYDRKMLEEYKKTRAEIEEKEAQLVKEHEELEILVAQAEEEKAAIELLINSKAQQLAQYEEDIAASEAELEEMEAEAAALDNRIAELEEQWRQENSRVIYDGGQFLFPLDYYSRVTSEFGWRDHPIFHTQRLHNGIDFGAPSGQPIKAAYRGEVVIAEYSSSAGNYIMLNHGNGLATVYMHCSKFNVSVGQVVEKGDIIGFVGSTGNSTGPHLHFSVRLNGEYIDPGPYIGMY